MEYSNTEYSDIQTFGRIIILNIQDHNGIFEPSDDVTSSIVIQTSLPDEKIIPAIKAAAQDFLNTSEGRKVWEEANHNFNYGDFDLNVSNDFCIPRGFHVIKDPKMITMNVDFNTILAQPKGEE